ncbi:copine I-like protein [Angomonas deanei]|uniref:Copine, putative n=1 Tax=Angomonas deanei TaxID=59799 RepID=A0A7G2C2D5_9TRYP|nr:copine I-like protein [Angomonas deanei]CAD2213958.1 Copine, putative [Angomonas deanei]|eukprot:EPY34811.1 copine I-like protein [Angomonas deanei]
MGAILSAKHSSLTLSLGKKGTVTVTAAREDSGGTVGVLQLTLRGKGQKKVGVVSRNNPYFTVSRLVTATGQRKVVYKSEVAVKTSDPQWKPTSLMDVRSLCGGDVHANCIAIDVYSDGKEMGGFVTSALTLQKGVGEFELILTKKGKSKSFGYVCLDHCQFTPMMSFLEHLQAGLEINIAFSIDFTGSNGDWRQMNSLHHYDPMRPNAYIRAMLAVSNVVQEYDSDRQFPAYGFGAVTPFTRGTSHFFPLNGSAQNAFLPGMQAVIDTYARLLPQLAFSGPTNFTPTIRNVTQGARQSPNVYTILLILTDGAITDMQDTIDAIVDADDAPLSIIIIGIGNADFSSMERLDGDDEPLRDRSNRVTRRDLVQFVPFRQFAGGDPALLAAAVLEEVPRQVEEWGRLRRR